MSIPASLAGIGLNTPVAPPAYMPIGQLIATGDFQFETLVGTVNSVPFEPKYLQDIGLYDYQGSMTHTQLIEFDGQTIHLIQTSEPGSPGQQVLRQPRSTKAIPAVRIAETVTVLADEVAAIRSLGSVELETVQTHADKKIQNAVRNIRSTMEWHRVQAAQGKLLDADGTVINNYFTLLGIAEPTQDMAWSNTNAGHINAVCNTILNTLEDALGNLVPGVPPIAICGRTFFNNLVTHPNVIDAYKYFQATQQRLNPNRMDVRYEDFEFGGIIWRQYRGKVNGTAFVPDAEARIVVDGLPGTYLGIFAPPRDIVDQVNKMGIPLYPTVKVLDHNSGYEFRIQSNPLHVMTRPAAAIKLYED